jgi:hypothetical protein
LATNTSNPKLTPELQRRIAALKKREGEIEAQIREVQSLGSLSQLNDDLLAVRQQIDQFKH